MLVAIASDNGPNKTGSTGGEETGKSKGPPNLKDTTADIGGNITAEREKLTADGSIAPAYDPATINTNYPVADAERLHDATAYLDSAKDAGGFTSRGLADNPLYAKAPAEIRNDVQSSMRDINKLDPVAALPAFTGLLNDTKFQDFAAKEVGAERLAKMNVAVSAAQLAKDKRNDGLDLALLRSEASFRLGVKMSGTGPTDLVPQKSVGSLAWLKAAIPGGSVDTGFGKVTPEISSLLKLPDNAAGSTVPPSVDSWLQVARYIAKLESGLLWLMRPPFVRGLNEFEKLITDLRALKALDLLALIQMPSERLEPGASDQVKRDAAVKLRLNTAQAEQELQRQIYRVLLATTRIPVYPTSLAPENVERTALRAHAKKALDAFVKYRTLPQKIEVCKIAMRDLYLRNLWLKHGGATYGALRRATGSLVFAYALRNHDDPQFDIPYLLRSTAKYIVEKREDPSKQAAPVTDFRAPAEMSKRAVNFDLKQKVAAPADEDF